MPGYGKNDPLLARGARCGIRRIPYFRGRSGCDFKEIPQAKELQSGQVGYEHVGVYVPHLETSVESLVKGFGCTLASMPANQNRVAFVRGPENLMLELIEA